MVGEKGDGQAQTGGCQHIPEAKTLAAKQANKLYSELHYEKRVKSTLNTQCEALFKQIIALLKDGLSLKVY